MNNEQRIIGTWATPDGKTLVFNANGTLTWKESDGKTNVYKFGVTDTMLAYQDLHVKVFNISISSDGKTLIMNDGSGYGYLLIKK